MEPERWLAVQRAALTAGRAESSTFAVPMGHRVIDRAANRRLATILDAAGPQRAYADEQTWTGDQPIGALLDALVRPKSYPADHGYTADDITTHHLPLIVGASVRAEPSRASEDSPPDLSKRYLLIDARRHAAPNGIEPLLR